jgi:putative DNA primase/helicase
MTINILNKEESVNMASEFFNAMFGSSLAQKAGEIEIRTFKPYPANYFFGSVSDAAKLAVDLCSQGIDVYFGVNPRIGEKGKKENVHYLSAFHAEIDYGSLGHQKEAEYATYEEALESINNFHLKPSIVVHSGGGFHCYWVLTNPLRVADIGMVTLENINKALTQALKGDSGTHDISRVLRVPGTFNFKQPENPRPVETISINDKTYPFDAFLGLQAALNDVPLNPVPIDNRCR